MNAVWKPKWFRYGLSVPSWGYNPAAEDSHDLVAAYLDSHEDARRRYVVVGYKGFHPVFDGPKGDRLFYTDVLALAEAEHGY